jgi:hypothetical protein
MKILLFIIVSLIALTAVHAEWCDGTDVDHNGAVDAFDKDIFSAYFRSVAVCTEENQYCQGLDFDDSGNINIIDLSYFGDRYGRTDCIGESIPVLPIVEKWCNGADVDHNGAVDSFDDEIFAAYFKAAASCTEENAYCQGLDFDDDGNIDIVDLSLFADNRGRTDCGTPDVPEFGLIAGMIAFIGAIGAFFLLRR